MEKGDWRRVAKAASFIAGVASVVGLIAKRLGG